MVRLTSEHMALMPLIHNIHLVSVVTEYLHKRKCGSPKAEIGPPKTLEGDRKVGPEETAPHPDHQIQYLLLKETGRWGQKKRWLHTQTCHTGDKSKHMMIVE